MPVVCLFSPLGRAGASRTDPLRIPRYISPGAPIHPEVGATASGGGTEPVGADMAMKMGSARFRSMRLCSTDDLEVDPLLEGPRRGYRRRRPSMSELYSGSSSGGGGGDEELEMKHSILASCVPLPNKRARNHVTLLVGEDQTPFFVEPQILDHVVVQCLLKKSSSPVGESRREIRRSASAPSSRCTRIRVNCDAILFEHILWLLNKDDPCLRHINVDELMEFYS